MQNEPLFIRTLVELADTLVDDFDVVDLLTLLSDRCVEVLDVSAAGIMLVSAEGDLRVIASSSDAMRIVELFELQTDEGPCVDCYRAGALIMNPDLAATRERWPRFSPVALESGFQSAHALPMRLRGAIIGALNLFRAQTGQLDEQDVLAAQALADVATIAILQHRVGLQAHLVNEQLNEALNSRIVIEQAKGVIAERAGIDTDEAFQRLRHHARSNNLRLADLARDVATGTLAVDNFGGARGGHTATGPESGTTP
ncbi:MAG TPA: GAF and ANTAR domain-containing protein [Acidimicrobiia bacterium]|jgi:GAF domain-containing protein|nr:GAF and ANTAR domain-containing protein [Acidimicrobiia bacterium]